jgi:hypothetical protein
MKFRELVLPTTDVLHDGCQKLVQALLRQFPSLEQKIKRSPLESMPVLAMS